jgi:hypothetical protein
LDWVQGLAACNDEKSARKQFRGGHQRLLRRHHALEVRGTTGKLMLVP